MRKGIPGSVRGRGRHTWLKRTRAKQRRLDARAALRKHETPTPKRREFDWIID